MNEKSDRSRWHAAACIDGVHFEGTDCGLTLYRNCTDIAVRVRMDLASCSPASDI